MKHKNLKIRSITEFLLFFVVGVIILLVFKGQFNFQDNGTRDFGPVVTSTPIPGYEKMTTSDIQRGETVNGINLHIQNWNLSLYTPKKVTFSFSNVPLELNKKMVMVNTLNLRKNVSDSNDFELYDIEITAVDSKYDTFENVQKTRLGLVKKQYGNNYPLCFEKVNVTYEGTTQNTCFYQKANGGYHIVSFNFLSRKEARSEVETILSNIKLTP